MAAKLLHSLTDDNPDLQKQIGCMTGVFQLFDRHQIVPGRRFPGHSPKRLPPGSPQFDNITPESESSNSHLRPYTVESHSNKIAQDKNNRASTESSRDSFSSMSRSSSFSSLDCNVNKPTHQEPDTVIFPDTPSRDSLARQSCGSRLSVDLRDVVKDSMYRHKPASKDESPDHVMNYRESLDALAKFQESSWYYNEPGELSRSKSYQIRDGSSFSVPKDCPRFSYDGRETNRLSFQSRDISKTMGIKLEETPRLSLDTKESSTRSLRNPKSDDVTTANRATMQSRPPSVVAKLMGLEALPDSASNQKETGLGLGLGLGPIRTSQVEDINLLSKSLKPVDIFGPIKMHGPSRSSPREPTSPLWRNSDMKPISKFPIEPAPWKQRDASRSPQRPVSRSGKSPNKIHSSYSSVYSEVDKRLKDLEFTQSGKDLRALKQILEAMQSIEARKEGTQSMVKRQPVYTQNERFPDRQNPNGSDNLKAYESPIVVIRPAKLVERSGVEELMTDDRKIFTNRIPKGTRRENVNTVVINEVKSGGRQARNAVNALGLTKQQQLTKENATSSGKSTSPRLQQKRAELERRSRPPTPPADSSKMRKQSVKQVAESSSTGGRRRSKNTKVQQLHHEINGESKKLVNIQQHDGQLHEVASPQVSKEIDDRKSPSLMQEKSTLLLREDESVDPEYPSPVSVLDDGVYVDDSPSSVKHMLKTMKDDTAAQGIKDQWESPDDVIPDTLSSGVASEINRKKLQNIENLVQKLTRLNSTHDEAHTDYIASLCENTKPDDRYISEILLASGLLLRDLGSNLTTFQFHSSGHPINPELFLVLEQTKFSNLKQEPEKITKKEKFHRKLIFDAVNEILAGKLASSVPFQKSFKLTKKTLNAQKLLRELCLEIEQLQLKKKKENISLDDEDEGLKSVLWEEVLNRAESWTDYNGELPVLALEVERLIFKDLVNEVILGEAADGKRIKPGRRCRQLFTK